MATWGRSATVATTVALLLVLVGTQAGAFNTRIVAGPDQTTQRVLQSWELNKGLSGIERLVQHVHAACGTMGPEGYSSNGTCPSTRTAEERTDNDNEGSDCEWTENVTRGENVQITC